MEVGGYAAVKRNHIRKTTCIALEASDDGIVRALEDANDASFETARRLALDAHEDAIAMHRLGEVRGRNVDVVPLAGLRIVGHDEAEAGWIGLEASCDEVFRVGQRVAIAAPASAGRSPRVF